VKFLQKNNAPVTVKLNFVGAANPSEELGLRPDPDSPAASGDCLGTEKLQN